MNTKLNESFYELLDLKLKLIKDPRQVKVLAADTISEFHKEWTHLQEIATHNERLVLVMHYGKYVALTVCTLLAISVGLRWLFDTSVLAEGFSHVKTASVLSEQNTVNLQNTQEIVSLVIKTYKEILPELSVDSASQVGTRLNQAVDSAVNLLNGRINDIEHGLAVVSKSLQELQKDLTFKK